MNKEEYLSQLKKYLKRLSKNDYENAMDYFTEYFEEAGEEGEQRVIKELGTPKAAAADLIANLLEEKASGKKMELKKTSIGNVIGLSFLAIFAAPIGIPLLCAAVMVLLSIVIVIGCLIISAFIFSLSLFLIGGKFVIRGIVAIPFSASGACMIMGIGIACIGLGILMIFAGWYLAGWFRKWVPWIVRKMLKKEREKNEEEC